MKNLLSFLLACIFLLGTQVFSQTPGLIYKPAGSTLGRSVLDPNGDGFVSSTTSGFSSTDYGSASELNMVPLPIITAEPIGDLTTGGSGGATDIVSATSNQSCYVMYSVVNSVPYMIVRFRLGNASTSSKGYTLLFDTDGNFGRASANPGFEKEIVLQTGNSGGVVIYTYSPTDGSLTNTLTYDINNYQQRSIAVSANSGDADYFYDFFVPFSDLGISTYVRIAAATITSASSGILGSKSDFNGVNDNLYGNNASAIYNALIPAFPSTLLTSLTAGASFPSPISNAPVVNGGITTASTTISGTSSEANGTTITIYKNGTSIGTATVSSNIWTLSSVSGLAAGNLITAKATASGKTISVASNAMEVTAVGSCYTPVPTNLVRQNGQTITGNYANADGSAIGANSVQIKLYSQVNNGTSVTFTEIASSTGNPVYVATNGTWSFATNLGQSTFNTTSIVSTATKGGCVSGYSVVNKKTSGQVGTITATPTMVTTQILASASISRSVQVTNTDATAANLILYINSNQVAVSPSTVASGATYTFNYTGFIEGDIVSARAQSVTSNYWISNPSTSVTVIASATATTAPSISGTYLSGSGKTVSGICTESAGTVISLYKAGTTLLGTTTVDVYGVWSVTGLTLATGDVLTATAKATGKTLSSASVSVTVAASAPSAPTVTGSYQAGATSVSGTGGNGTITVYVDGSSIGTTTGASWSLSGISSNQIYKGAKITATNTVSGIQSVLSNQVTATGVTSFLITNTSDAAIASQVAGVSFPIKITAKDAANGTGNTVTTYTSKVVMSSTSAILNGGGSTSNFTAGILNPHAVSLTTSGSQTIYAVSVDDPTAVGSASVTILPITLTSSAGPNGSISPNGATDVNYGNNQSYTLTPNTGYHVADVLVDGSSVGAVTSYTFTNVTTTHTISASFAINTYNVTSSAGANGSISPNGSTSVNHGNSQAYTITANSGYHVSDVLVDGSSVGAVTSYTFTNVTATHTISASFAINTYNITSSAGSNGSISPDGSTSVNHGSSQAYTITANSGYHVSDVMVDGSSVGAVTSYTFTNVTATHTISASFAINTYNIASSAGSNGSISPNGSTGVNHGSSQSYTITANTNYHVADVLVDGSSVGAVTSYTFTNVTATHTISASFAINTYNVTSSAGSNGSISPNGATSVNHGSNQSYTVTPNSGYHVSDVLVDGSSVGAVTSYTFTNVTATHTIAASFAINTYNIASSAGSNGSISPDGSTSVNHGSSQSYVITANSGYHVSDVLVDGSSVGAVTSYTFTNVTETHIISASFAINSYNITSSAGSNGSISPNGSTSVNHGGSQSYTITPNSGYLVSDVLVDGSSVGAVTSYTFANVTSTHTISASFTFDCSNYTFVGTVDNDYFKAANWMCGVAPPPTTPVAMFIEAAAVLSSDYTVLAGGSLKIKNGGSLTIASTAILTIKGSADFNGQHVTIRSDANGTGAIGEISGTLTGATNVTVERYIPERLQRSWRLLSAPISGQTVKAAWQEGGTSAGDNPHPGYGTFITKGNNGAGSVVANPGNGFDYRTPYPSLQKFNGTSWVEAVSNTNTLLDTKEGYFLYIRGDRDPQSSPSINTTTVRATTLRSTGSIYYGPQSSTFSNNYGVVGNIYPSAIDLVKIIDRGGLQNVNLNWFYVWDPTLFADGNGKSLGGYRTMFRNVHNGKITTMSPVDKTEAYQAPTAVIESGQAMIFKKTSSSATITFNESDKVSSSNLVFRPAGSDNTIGQFSVNLRNAANGLADGNVALFGAGYSNTVDDSDVPKFGKDFENFSLTRTGTLLNIETRDQISANDTLYYDLQNIQQNKQYKLEFISNNMTVAGLSAFLEDKYLGTTTAIDITSSTLVNFTANSTVASYARDRFRVVFKVSGTVPVGIVSLTASQQGTSNVTIGWKVATENGVLAYEVERSVNGVQYNHIGTVSSVKNNGLEVSYTYSDEQTISGTGYYRIKMIMLSGEVRYSSVAKVTIGELQSGFSVYPNPVENGLLNLQLKNQPSGKYGISILNTAGQIIYTGTRTHTGGNRTEVFTLPTKMSAGVYSLEIQTPDKGSEKQKLIIR